MTEKLKILHIEDLAEDAELVARALKNLALEYELTVVSTKEDYLRALSQDTPDIILSDHSLPGFNSIEALNIARESGLKIPFILITATVSDDFAISVIKKGATDYILKERLGRLPNAIESAMETYKLEKGKIDSEQRFRALIEHSEDMLILLSANKNITYYSPAVERILGYGDGDNCAGHFANTVHPDDQSQLDLQIEEVFQSPGKPVASLIRLIKKDGKYVWAEGTFTNMLFVPGVQSIVANFRDVTHRKETEEILEKTEERYRRIVETAQEGIWVIDTNKKTVFVNHKLCEILEYSADEMMGKTNLEFMDEADVPAGIAAIKRREQGIKETLELRYLTKTRRYIWANVSAVPIIDENGQYQGALAMITDITQRKLAEDALVRNEALMRSILENSQDAIILYDKAGKVVYESPAIVRMLGYLHHEIFGKNRAEFFHPDELEQATIFFNEVLNEPGVSRPTRRRLRHKNGHYIWVEGTVTNLLNDRNINGIITNFRDVSERLKAEEALKESEYKFRSLIQRSSDAITVINEKEDIIFASDSLYHITGFTVEEMMNEPSRQYVHPLDMPSIHETFLDLVAHPGSTRTALYRRLKKDGSYFWCEAIATNLLQEPAVGGIVINFRDITERKEAEQRLQESINEIHAAAERQSAILNSLNAHIALLDSQGVIIKVNEAWEKFGNKNHLVSKTYCVGDNYITISNGARGADEASGRAMANGIQDVLSGKIPEYSMEYPCNSPGEQRWFCAIVTPLNKNRYKGVVVSHADVTESKLSQVAQQRSEANLTAIIENTDAHIYSLDKEFRYVFFNTPLKEAIYEAYGVEIAPGDKTFALLEQIEPLEARWWEDVYTKAFKGEKMQFVKDYSTHSRPGYISFSINPIWENNEVTGLSCFASNVTEQKLSEERVLHTEHLLSEAQQLAKMGNWNVDMKKKETYWSQGTRVLYGVDDDFVPGSDSFNAMVHPDDQERVINEINEAERKGQTLEHLYRIIRTDGEIRVLNSQTHFIRDAEGNSVRVYGIQQDITDMKKAEETTRRSEANLNTIFNNGDTIYILIDCNFKIVSFNQLAKKYAEDELLAPMAEGKNLMDCIEEERRALVYDSLETLLTTHDPSLETEYSLSGNSDKSYYTRYFPVSNDANEVFGVIIAINDITERKLEELKTLKLLELVQKKNKDLGQFAYIVSHNLRSPIAKIQGLVTLLESGGNDDIPDKSLIEYIANETVNLDNVVKDLNTIITARDVGSEMREYVNFEEQLKLILHVLEDEIQECDAMITYYFPEPSIYTIKSYMYSMMYNLISNAIKYRSPQQQLSIYIQTKRENDFLCLSIADNGMGMDMAKNQRKIFGLYRRFHGDTIPGKGIGLYLVKTQAETLGGTVDVKSEVNEGTTFKISIPI